MLNSIAPGELGRELRHRYIPLLKRRRGIIGLCFFSCGVLSTLHSIKSASSRSYQNRGGEAHG